MISLKEETKFLRVQASKYGRFAPKVYRQLTKLRGKLKGHSVIHISATAKGGGVAEMLRTQIPLERSPGFKSRWFVLQAPPEFFEITKKIHNLLQGQPGVLTPAEKKRYLAGNLEIAEALRKFLRKLRAAKPPLIFLHDPQLLAAVGALANGVPAVLRIHLDLSSPNTKILKFFLPFLAAYRRIVISNHAFKKIFPKKLYPKIIIIPPAIDPLAQKNRPLEASEARRILKNFGINPRRPLFVQVSRFDPWKDPLGVLEIFKRIKKKLPEAQLVLAGFLVATDDPEGIRIFEKVKRAARKIPGVHLFADPRRLGKISNDLFISALYAAATAVIQKSKREGFGLTVTEAMWKGKVVVAGRTAGTKLQISHCENGFLSDSVPETASHLLRLYKNKKLRRRLGRAAKKSVRKSFLMPRLLADHLKLYAACYND